MSPGGRTPYCSRRTPELPPLSAAVTTAVIRHSGGRCRRSPLRTTGNPLPPPRATMRESCRSRPRRAPGRSRPPDESSVGSRSAGYSPARPNRSRGSRVSTMSVIALLARSSDGSLRFLNVMADRCPPYAGVTRDLYGKVTIACDREWSRASMSLRDRRSRRRRSAATATVCRRRSPSRRSRITSIRRSASRLLR